MKPSYHYKRFNLILDTLIPLIQHRAKLWDSQMAETIRRLIRIGLMVCEIMDDPEKKLLVQEGESTREIVIT